MYNVTILHCGAGFVNGKLVPTKRNS